MAHPNTIFVTSLFDMPHYVRELEPARLVSIIQPELQPARPAEVTRDAHLRVAVHDIAEPEFDCVLIEEAHVRQLIGFIEAWDAAEGALLTHCYAGISRSTAVALIACYVKTGDGETSAVTLRTAAPHAAPNRRIISLADTVLGCAGALIDARERMGAPLPAIVEAPLTTLRFDP